VHYSLKRRRVYRSTARLVENAIALHVAQDNVLSLQPVSMRALFCSAFQTSSFQQMPHAAIALAHNVQPPPWGESVVRLAVSFLWTIHCAICTGYTCQAPAFCSRACPCLEGHKAPPYLDSPQLGALQTDMAVNTLPAASGAYLKQAAIANWAPPLSYQSSHLPENRSQLQWKVSNTPIRTPQP